jgi:hypothetical protein
VLLLLVDVADVDQALAVTSGTVISWAPATGVHLVVGIPAQVRLDCTICWSDDWRLMAAPAREVDDYWIRRRTWRRWTTTASRRNVPGRRIGDGTRRPTDNGHGDSTDRRSANNHRLWWTTDGGCRDLGGRRPACLLLLWHLPTLPKEKPQTQLNMHVAIFSLLTRITWLSESIYLSTCACGGSTLPRGDGC